MKKLFYLVISLLAFIFLYPWLFFRKADMYQGKKHRDVAIVLGYPGLKNGQPSLFMLSRVEKAVQLWKQHHVDYLIMSGGAAHNDMIEATMMKEIAVQLGVPKDAIFIETKARNTYQNLLYTKEILDKYAFHSCLIVTNTWHIKRAQFFVDKFKIDGEMVACRTPDYPKFYLFYTYIHESICMMKCHYYELKSYLKRG